MIHPSMKPSSMAFGQFTASLLSAELHENATYYTFLFDTGASGASVKLASRATDAELSSDTVFSYEWEHWDLVAHGNGYGGTGTALFSVPIGVAITGLLEARGFWSDEFDLPRPDNATVMQAMTMSWAVDLLTTEPNAYEYHFFDDEVWIYAKSRSLHISQAGADLDELYQLELRGGAGIETRYVANHMDLAAETRRMIRAV
jgi:hypothetical protein